MCETIPRISVVLPAFNSQQTIAATLDTVLKQTLQPYEILVVDDGSTDRTLDILASFDTRIRILQQENKGVAAARNRLCELATGDLIAFLDSDDLWKNTYLETQGRLFQLHPYAVAFYSGHVDFHGILEYDWTFNLERGSTKLEVLSPHDFFIRYNQSTGLFASMSYCCVPKRVLAAMGPEPFCVSGVDDSYLAFRLALWGPVVYNPEPLVAYRVSQASQSASRLKIWDLWLQVFELVKEDFETSGDENLIRAFETAFASKRRSYGKLLMGSGRVSSAREQIRRSTHESTKLNCRAKSLFLLFLTYLPASCQPIWPSDARNTGRNDIQFVFPNPFARRNQD